MYRILILILLYEKEKKYKGVSWNKKMKKWVASKTYNGTIEFIGHFNNDDDAAKAVNWYDIKMNVAMTNPEVGVLEGRLLEELKQCLKQRETRKV
jgi:hypothetical protein